MNDALTQDDVTDMVAIRKGATNPDGSRRSLRVSEVEDAGDRLWHLGLASVRFEHVELTEAGHVELEARGL